MNNGSMHFSIKDLGVFYATRGEPNSETLNSVAFFLDELE